MDPEVFFRHKDFFNNPYILTDEELKHPTKVLFYFLDMYQLSEVRSLIALPKDFVIKANTECFTSDKGRANLSFFLNQFEQVAEAIHQLKKNQKARKGQPKKATQRLTTP